MATEPIAPGLDGPVSDAMLKLGRFFTKWDQTDDGRAVFREGGRKGDVFYRDRWSYVKDGIITWESQQTDYPSVGPDSPEYEPRGCPRGAAFSWYTYSPTRVRFPYARGVLVEMYREAKGRLQDPVLAWANVVSDPQRRRRYQQARAKGGLVRVSWQEAIEMAAAAHTHTIKTYGPDRCSGFSPIPAMSKVGSISGIVSAAGGLRGYFPPPVIGATYNPETQSYSIGLLKRSGHDRYRLRKGETPWKRGSL